MPLRIDRFTIDSFEMVGTRLRVDGYLSRTGVQIYDQGDGTKQREQRDASEVFRASALASMRAMPVTVGHPSNRMVDAKNWRDLSHGHVGDDVRQADDGIHTRASIWILDADTQRQVKDKNLTELSVGYYADLDETPGRNDMGEEYDVRQINIKGNHLAMIRDGEARGGRECRLRLDMNGDATFINKKKAAAAPVPVPERKEMAQFNIRADGYEHIVTADTDALPVALEKERAKAKAVLDAERARVVEANETLETTKAKLDSADTEKTDLQAKLDALEAAIAKAELEALRAEAKKLGGEKMDTSGDAKAIKVRALTAAGITEVCGAPMADQTDAYIDARFDIALETSSKRTQQTDALSLARQAVVDGVAVDKHEPIDLAGIIHDRFANRGEAS